VNHKHFATAAAECVACDCRLCFSIYQLHTQAPTQCYSLYCHCLQVKFSVYAWLLQPVNVDGVHWVLLAGHVPSTTVSLVDSLSWKSSQQYLDKWRLLD